jgi:hypothetical protein
MDVLAALPLGFSMSCTRSQTAFRIFQLEGEDRLRFGQGPYCFLASKVGACARAFAFVTRAQRARQSANAPVRWTVAKKASCLVVNHRNVLFNGRSHSGLHHRH